MNGAYPEFRVDAKAGKNRHIVLAPTAHEFDKGAHPGQFGFDYTWND